MTIAPDGTLIIKNQTRPTPCDIQGTLAAFQCPGGIAASPGSNIAAVDPDTFEIYDDIDVPENAVSPFSITMYEGRVALYDARKLPVLQLPPGASRSSRSS